MAFWQRLKNRMTDSEASSTPGETDTGTDSAVAGTRATGGASDPDADDPNSTTGTTESGSFVGRASGDEVGDVDESGGEKRARWEQQGRPDGGPQDEST
jgi:hypothetical protein